MADDAPAFVAAGNAMYADPGSDLVIPAGTYPFLSSASASGRLISRWTQGITGRILGADPSTTNLQLRDKCNQFGSFPGIYHDGNHWGAVASVSAGSSTVTLITLADYTKFSVGQWILMSGLNQQDIYSDVPNTGYGYPPNLTIFEYVQITNINSGTGVITLSAPLQNSYLSTWPSLNTGSAFESNAGGPAGFYGLDPDWGMQIEFHGLNITTTTGNQIYAACRSIIYRDCTFLGASSPIPSSNQTWAAYDCTSVDNTEVDKLVTNFIMDGCTWHRLSFQSASVTNFTMTNTALGSMTGGLNGCGMNTTIDGCTISDIAPGAYAYGVNPGIFNISNTSVTSWRYGGYDDSCEAIGTMSGGVIAIPNGTSVSNITDNGSGKARYTVTSTAGLTAGKWIGTSSPKQELSATASTSIGNPTVTFGGGVPAWIVAGQALVGGQYFANGTTVSSTTATTITFSTNATSTVSSGAKFAFASTSLTSSGFTKPPGAQILTVVNGTTVDMDQTYPGGGFAYSYGGSLGFNNTIRWTRPGTYMYWSGSTGIVDKFKVLGVTQDANKMYVQTDLAGGFPSLPIDSTRKLEVFTPGAQRVRASALTGTSPHNASIVAAAAYDKPLGSYSTFTYTGSNSSVSTTSGIQVYGNLVSITIDVTQAYTGSLFSTLFLHLAQFAGVRFIVDGVSQLTGWGIDLKTVGTRIILPTNTVTNPTKQTNDSALLVPAWSSSLWLNTTPAYNLQTTASAGGTTRNISGEASNLWPIVNIEIITDQGFVFSSTPTAVVPLRFRLRTA